MAGFDRAAYDRARNRTPERRASMLERKYESRRIKHQIVRDYKAVRGCMDCGELDPIVLELDHRDPELKNWKLKRTGTKRPASDWGRLARDELLPELQKCDVVCANCHRRRTAARRNNDDDVLEGVN